MKPPLVVVPGIQGRWEWLTPALSHLADRLRTVTYSLSGDTGADHRLDPALGFENYLRQLDDVLDRASLDRVALCGVSYGGFIALRYAATRPHRVSSLVLASSPSPGWRPNPRQGGYIERPWISTPLFLATAPVRLGPEIYCALDDWPSRISFCAEHMARVIAAPPSPSLMASRIREQQALDFFPDCARIQAPTLITTGEAALDTVVPVEATREYLSLIAGSKYAMIERTGHLGLLTRPARFATIVSDFVEHAHCQ
ncbi:MAG TPA: alpha/beta hydrolase [Vicinamibacterales bacterium]|nr:alpha/beta hydrolase [Vicinamibacterales bacterium]